MKNPLTEGEREWLINQIIIWICDEEKGKAVTKELVVDAVAELSDEDALELIFEAFEKIEKEQKLENAPEEIRAKNIAIYEDIYHYFKSIDLAAGMNKTLRAKERFLGLVTDQNKLVLKKSETIIHASTSNVDYDTTKLTSDELQELEELLAKCLVS